MATWLLVASILALVPVGLRVARAVDERRRAATLQGLLATFGPAAASAQEDSRRLVGWYPIAMAGRKLFPEAFRELDAATGGPFPFAKRHLEAAHARCTADWLAWERSHEADHALRAAAVEDEIARMGGQTSPLLRTRR